MDLLNVVWIIQFPKYLKSIKAWFPVVAVNGKRLTIVIYYVLKFYSLDASALLKN